MTPTRTALTAGALSLGLHAALLLSWARLGRATVLPPGASKPRPVEMEVMRLAGIVAPHAPAGVARPAAPGRPTPPTVANPTRPVEAAQPPGVPSGLADPTTVSVNAVPAAQADGDSAAALGEGSAAQGEGSAAQGESSAAQGTPSNAGGAGGGLDTSDLARRLQEGALRCYPPAARRFRQLGEAQVRFCLDGGGALREATVSTSSGFELLDRAARECVVPGAAPFGPETFGRCFTVPVRFHQQP